MFLKMFLKQKNITDNFCDHIIKIIRLYSTLIVVSQCYWKCVPLKSCVFIRASYCHEFYIAQIHQLRHEYSIFIYSGFNCL